MTRKLTSFVSLIAGIALAIGGLILAILGQGKNYRGAVSAVMSNQELVYWTDMETFSYTLLMPRKKAV